MPTQHNNSNSTNNDNFNSVLSCREIEILQELVHGSSNKIIAAFMGITINTVEKHLTGIYKKLGIKNRSEAILWWLKNGGVFRN